MPRTIENHAPALAAPGPFAGLLMGVLIAFGSSPALANLLRNPSFEETPCETPCNQVQGSVPAEWLSPLGSPDTFSNDGSYGLKPGDFGNFSPEARAQDGIRWLVGWSNLPEIFCQELTAPLTPGKVYVLSAFMLEAVRADLAHPGTYQLELWDVPNSFTADKIILGSMSPPIANQVEWEPASLTFTAPPASDTHPVLVFVPKSEDADVGGSYPGLDNVSLELAGDPRITSVTPASISPQGGEELTFVGVSLPSAFIPRLGGIPLTEPQFLSSSVYRGFAPALPPGRYTADLWDGEGVVVASLEDAVEVAEPSGEAPPPPVVIDADFAEGTARFNWINPIRYDSIRVRDRSGSFIRELDGVETTLVVPGTRDGVELLFEGFQAGVASRFVCAFAAPADCDVPAPLGGFANPGQFEFPLYGGNLPRNPARCSAGGGGGAGGGQGEGGGAALNLLEEWSGVNGFLQAPASSGYTVRARDRIDPDLLVARSYANRVVTGFTLENDSDRLQIEGYYQKLTESPGLELKGRLVHVFPADGFEDEFTFQDVPPGEPKRWHEILYYRANIDPSLAGAEACDLSIPKGDYILQIYAVNGDATQVHYSFADDDRDRELLIPGAPCPPYPLVRVRDLTGKTTLPDIHRLTAITRDDTHVEFHARGIWFDADGGHSVDPDDDSYRCHNFEFVWEVQGARLPTPQSTGNSNVFVAEVFSLGCFWVNLTIRDKACGRYVFRRLQVLAEPKTFQCTTAFYSATQPVPDPRGIIAVAGLTPAPGAGRMAKPRPYSASVLIVPQDLCDGTGLAVAASAGDPEVFGDEDIEFRLAWFAGLGLIEAIPPSEIKVKDLCASAQNSVLRYFQIDIDDLGRARPLPPPLDTFTRDGKLAPVLLQSRTKVYRRRNTQGGIDRIQVTPREEDWKVLGGVMMMTNRPDSFTQSHWQGSFSERDQTYSFFTHAAEAYQQHFDLEKSKSIPVGIVSGVNIPSFDNDFSTGLNSPFRYVNGAWLEDYALADNTGDILGNKISASTLQVEGLKRQIDEATTYEWCKSKEIFSNVTEQTLFESIIFSGAIGPVPLTIWAKVGLALTVSLTAQVGTVISPFRALTGGNFVESNMSLVAALDLSIPAAIRADIAFGVVGVNYKLRPHVESSFNAHIESRDLELSKGLNLELAVQLDAQFQYCFFNFLESLLGDLTCIPAPLIPIIPREVLIAEHIGSPFNFKPCPSGDGGGGDGGGLPAQGPPAEPDGMGGGDFTFDVEYYFPAVESSPDGRTEIEVVYQKSTIESKPRTLVRTRVNGIQQTVYSDKVRDLEPAIGFLSSSKALIAWTRSLPELAGLPPKSPEQYTLAELNLLRAQDEIVVTPLEADAGGSWSFDQNAIVISDAAAETPNPASRRVDGRAAVAGDPTREMALVAWVRIDDPDYLKSEPGTTTYYRPETPGSTTFVPDQAPTVRPHLERSAIYVRPVGLSGPLGPARVISAPGINLEPSITFSPSGNQAYCVWVHDPVHVDLIGSNRGRNLVFALYTAAQDVWSAPRAIVSNPDSAFPGLLEPSIGLKADGTGVLAFTALEVGSSERDTGLLASNRLVYISRLEGGVFGPPVLIHGKCQKRVYGSTVRVRIPPLVEDPPARVFKKPDIYVLWQQGGPPGTPESSGGLVTSILDDVTAEPSAAVVVSTPGSVRENVVAAVSSAGIRAVALNSGPALRAGLGAGGGVSAESAYESESTPLAPDLGISSCVLSNQFPGPGARISAQVELENIGFAASAADAQGQSEVKLRAVYVDAAGSTRVAVEVPVPVIPAGGTVRLDLTLEQPLEPVELRVGLSPNPGDTNPTNDVRVCAFGAPMPQSFACQAIELTDEAATPAFLLSWKNAANYDELILYRDGAQLASISGGCTAYVDRDAEPGQHTWEIRGRIDVSKSCRGTATCEMTPSESFRRGDVDSSGDLNITDPVALLGFLFLGGTAPRCPDAADADDSGDFNITDPISILGYLFLGGSAPPAPGPQECGSDPTPDSLERCATDCR